MKGKQPWIIGGLAIALAVAAFFVWRPSVAA